MPFSHHSHSGQFCTHASNTLEEMVQAAIARKMRVYALTEHMPRNAPEDLYPEEHLSPTDLPKLFTAFLTEAHRLRTIYASQITLLIGFESEYIRPNSLPLLRSLLTTHNAPHSPTPIDFFVGSLHHALTIPIDYSRELYEEAVRAAGGTHEALWARYFDEQHEMLAELRPVVVGHFDVVRLFAGVEAFERGAAANATEKKTNVPRRSAVEEAQHPTRNRWPPAVWRRVLRNLHFIRAYGGLLELNSAGLRKGLGEPYPGREICRAFLNMGGAFTLSDDAHGVAHVATHYAALLAFIDEMGIKEVCYLERAPASLSARDEGGKRKESSHEGGGSGGQGVVVRTVSVEEMRGWEFWEGLRDED
ncbi:MAG: histidinolphosphatase [Piccolia ochrophora]|nr:MAG: histidinolphosphatase [Piccolia ochrophora]